MGLALYLGLVIIVDGYLNTGIYIPGLEQGSIRYSEVCAFILLIHRPPSEYSPPRTVRFLLGLYFALLFLSALRSDPMLAGIFEFRRLIVPQIVALLVAIRGLGSPADYRRFFLCLTALVVIVGLFVFWDVFFDRWLLKSESLSKPEYWQNRKHGRYGSFFLNPNYLGAFAVLVFPAAFVWTLKERRPWPRLYAWTGLLALVFCLVETQSRGPMLAFGIALLMLALGPCGGALSRKRRAGYLALFVTVFSLFMPGFYRHATERFSSLDQETTQSTELRRLVWLYSQRIIADQPLGGIGFGEHQFQKAMEDYGFVDPYGESLHNPHNSYLQMVVYAGIPALAAFLLANGALLRSAARVSLRGPAEGNTPTVYGLAIGIIGFLACIYPDMHLFTQTVAPVYWLFFGLLLSLVSRAPEANRYENRHPYLRNHRQRLAGQSTPGTA